MILSLSGC